MCILPLSHASGFLNLNLINIVGQIEVVVGEGCSLCAVGFLAAPRASTH